VADQVVVIYAATNGYIDRILAERVPEFHEGLVARAHATIGDTLKKIAAGDWSDETQRAVDDVVAQFADDFGYDLDEEGPPLGERHEPRYRRREAEAREEETVEQEEAAGAAA
jgi:F-type H+-transporting ATPase subunit alpha